MKTGWTPTRVAVLALTAVGCEWDDGSGDHGHTDAWVRPDASLLDGSAADAAVPTDSRPVDARPMDANNQLSQGPYPSARSARPGPIWTTPAGRSKATP